MPKVITHAAAPVEIGSAFAGGTVETVTRLSNAPIYEVTVATLPPQKRPRAPRQKQRRILPFLPASEITATVAPPPGPSELQIALAQARDTALRKALDKEKRAASWKLFRRARVTLERGEPYTAHAALWNAICKDLGFNPHSPMLVVAMKAIQETAWDHHGIVNPSAWLRTTCKRMAERLGLAEITSRRIGTKADAAAQRIPEIEGRFKRGEITYNSYMAELRLAYADIESDNYAGTISDQRPMYHSDGERLSHEDWIDRKTFSYYLKNGGYDGGDGYAPGELRWLEQRLRELGLYLEDGGALCNWDAVADRAHLDETERLALHNRATGAANTRHQNRKLAGAMPDIVRVFGGPFHESTVGPRPAPLGNYERAKPRSGRTESVTTTSSRAQWPKLPRAKRQPELPAVSDPFEELVRLGLRRENGVLTLTVERVSSGDGDAPNRFVELMRRLGEPWHIHVTPEGKSVLAAIVKGDRVAPRAEELELTQALRDARATDREHSTAHPLPVEIVVEKSHTGMKQN